MSGENKAIEVLKTLAALDLDRWPGLPEDTLLEDARAVFSVDDQWHGSGKLGTDAMRTDWYSVAAEHFPQGLRLWVSDGRLVLVDAVYPDLPDGLDTLLDTLGEPAKRLDSYLGTLPVRNSEWVYPERGLTLFVNPPNRRLLRIAVYRPTSLEGYCKALRLELQKIRLPINGQRVSGGHR